MKRFTHGRTIIRPLAAALALGFGMGAGSLSAQTILEVAGDGVIGDETLSSNDLAASGATFSADGGTGVVQSHLISPEATVGAAGNATLRFTHRYDFEDNWDGGAVFVSINGAEATYVPSENFSANGYDGNPAAETGSNAWPDGEDVFTLGSAGYADPAFVESVVDLGGLNPGDTVSVEFRGWWDDGTLGPAPNWEIATVTLEDSASTILDVDFVADGKSGFTVNNIGGVAGPWTYLGPRHTFEIDADAQTADRYAPVAPGDAIDLNDADLVVEVLTGAPAVGDTYSLFDLSGGSSLTGSLSSITLPSGTEWDVSGLEAGGDGTITLLRYIGFKLLERDLIGGSDGNPNNTSEAEAILALAEPNAEYDYTDTEVVRNTINVAGGGSFGGTDPLPDGADNLDTYVLQATTHLEIPAGDWTIGFGSDDGGSLVIPGITFLDKTNDSGSAADEVRFEGTRGHQWTFGTFTLTEPLMTTLDAVMFESGGGDSWEIAIFEGHTTEFDSGSWVLLEDGAKNWTVEWADTFPPVISSTFPEDDAADTFVSGNLIATFNEPIALTGNGTITIDHLGGGADITIALPDSRVTTSGRDLVIDPGTNLDFNANYAVRISDDAIEDLPNPVGNAFGGISDTTSWNFTTVTEDTSAPTIAAVDPDGTTVLPNSGLTITFDENILLAESVNTALIDESFDGDDGGFTVKVADAVGTPWAHGDPDSNGEFGGSVTSDNSGTGQAWATGLGDFSNSSEEGYYADPTNTCLRTPVIDLTGFGSASLTFAEALDVESGDTAEVRIIEAATDTVIATVYSAVDDDVNASPWQPANGGDPIDLSPGAGQMVRIEWCLEGVGGGTDDYMGWYIDDVRVTGLDTSTAIVLKNLTAGTSTAIPVGDSDRLSVSGNVLTISPGSLDPGADYAVRIGNNALKNYSGVFFPGINDDTTWAFATSNATIMLSDSNWVGGDWSDGEPGLEKSAIINPNVTAIADSSVAEWSGDLVLEPGSRLSIRDNTAPGTYLNPLHGAETVFMNDGAIIGDSFRSIEDIPADFVLDNGGGFQQDAGTSGWNRDRRFQGVFSGTGPLTIDAENLMGYGFFQTNTYTGGLILDAGNRYGVGFYAAGSAGAGDVTVNSGSEERSAVLFVRADDVFDPSCVLTLNGLGWNGTSGGFGPYAGYPGVDGTQARIVMEDASGTPTNATVSQLFVDGINYPAGTYSSVGNASVDHPSSFVVGDGVLTVSTDLGDAVAPVLGSLSPANGATDVSPSTGLVIDFDENSFMALGTGNVTLYDAADDSIIETIDVTAGQVELTGTTEATITPSVPLDFGSSVYVQIDPGAFRDGFGNDYAGFTDKTTWTFSTVALPGRSGPVTLIAAAAAGETITNDEFVHNFDTFPRLSTAHDLASSSDIQMSTGHHLVIYSSRFDSSGGGNRSEIQTQLNLAGTDLSAGWSQGYIRRTGDSYETVTAGGAIIEVTNPGDLLQLQSFRTDDNTGAGVVRADSETNAETLLGEGPAPGEDGSTGIQLLKLDDGWDYLRLAGHDGTGTDQALPAGADNPEAVVYNQVLESDGAYGFTPGSGDITLNQQGHYLILANTYANGDDFGSREQVTQFLSLDGTEVAGTKTTTYIRDANACIQGAVSLGTIIETTAPSQVLNVSIMKDAGQSGGFIVGERTAVTIVKLPDSADYVRLRPELDVDDAPVPQNINTDTAFSFGTQDEVDSAFTHDAGGAPTQVAVNNAGDYLFFASYFVPTTDTSNNRRFPNQGWRVNGTGGFSAFGQTGRYNRHTAATPSCGNWSGFVAGLSATDYVEAVSRQLGDGGAENAVVALQGLSVDSLFGTTPPGDTYGDWIAGFPGVGAADGFDDDPDGDGNANGIENYFGTDPGVFSAGVTEIAVSGSTVTFSHPLNDTPADDVAAGYLWSEDLATFHPDGGDNSSGTTVDFVQATPSGGMVDVTATITGPVPAKLFIAVEVSQTTP